MAGMEMLTTKGNAQIAIGKCDAVSQHRKIKPGCGCLVAQDKHPDWDTSGVSVVCQRPRKHHQCENAAFRRRRHDGLTTLTNRPLAGLPF